MTGSRPAPRPNHAPEERPAAPARHQSPIDRAPERDQKALYDRIAAEHEAHNDDEESYRFREAIIYPHLFGTIDFTGARVLEAMCGSGQVTRQLLTRGAQVTGLDLSYSQVERFKSKFPRCAAVCGSTTDLGLASNSVDHVIIVGGLHHTHPRLEDTVGEIHRVLKPGGYLCFSEPHAGTLPNLIRKVWYRIDPLFLPNEAAIDLENLKRTFANSFRFGGEHYLGNIGYVFIFNSQMLRVPLWLKRAYTPLMMQVERFLGPLQSRRLSCFCVSQWQKR
jgi:SAM-dependent methyltransferase